MVACDTPNRACSTKPGDTDVAYAGAALQGLPGRFILTLNDVPEVRGLFAWATIETVELSYQAGGAGHTKRVRELIVGAEQNAS